MAGCRNSSTDQRNFFENATIDIESVNSEGGGNDGFADSEASGVVLMALVEEGRLDFLTDIMMR